MELVAKRIQISVDVGKVTKSVAGEWGGEDGSKHLKQLSEDHKIV